MKVGLLHWSSPTRLIKEFCSFIPIFIGVTWNKFCFIKQIIIINFYCIMNKHLQLLHQLFLEVVCTSYKKANIKYEEKFVIF